MHNIDAALRMMKGDANRWRPHLKTAKLGYTMRRMVERGIRAAKCATTLELVTALEAGMEDVVVAFPVMGANAARVREIASRASGSEISLRWWKAPSSWMSGGAARSAYLSI